MTCLQTCDYSALLTPSPRSIVLSNDGNFAALVHNKSISILDTVLGRCLHTLHIGYYATSCAFSQDTTRLATADNNLSELIIWSVASGLREKNLEIDGEIISLAFTPNPSRLVLACDAIELWDIDLGICIWQLEASGYPFEQIACSRNFKLLAIGNLESTIQVTSLKDGQPALGSCRPADPTCEYFSTADFTLIAAANIFSHSQSRDGGREPDIELDTELDSDSEASQVCDCEPQVAAWKTMSSSIIAKRKAFRRIGISNDYLLAAGASGDGDICIWILKTGVHVMSVGFENAQVKQLTFSNDSTLLAIEVCEENSQRYIWIWSLEKGEFIDQIETNDDETSPIAFACDSQLIAIGGASRRSGVGIWELNEESYTYIDEYDFNCSVEALAFSPDSVLLACIGSHGYLPPRPYSLKIWHREQRQCVYSMPMGDVISGVPFYFDPGIVQVGSFFTDSVWGGCKPRIITNCGIIELYKKRAAQSQDQMIYNPTTYTRSCFWGLSKDRCWLTWNDENWLWLPVNVRPELIMVSSSTVVIGYFDHQILIIRFNSP